MKLCCSNDVHTNARNLSIFKAVITNVLAKAINMGSVFITIPVTLKYLGTELFAIWMAITSFTCFLTFADLGLGIGLQNALARCNGKDDKDDPKYYLSSAYLLMLIIAFFIILLTLFVLPDLPVENLIISEDNHRTVILPTLQTFIILFSIGLPTSLITRVLTAYQKMHISGNLLIVGRTIGLITIFISIWNEASLPTLTLGYIGSPIFINLIYSFYYINKNRWIRPSIKHVGKKYIKEVTSTGIWNVLAKISYTIKMNLPLIIISSSIGATAVAQFSVTQRILSIAGILINVCLQPLWPAYGEAYHRGDRAWIDSTFKKSLKLVLLVSGILFTVMMFVGLPMIKLWTNSEDVLPTFSLLMTCNAWMIISNINVCLTMLLNGLNRLRSQATYGLSLVIFACILSKFVTYEFGSEGILWPIILIAEVVLAIIMFIEIRSIITKKIDKVKCCTDAC